MIAKELPVRTPDMPASSTASGCSLCGNPAPQVWLTAPDRFNGRQKLYELVRCPSCSLVWLKDPPSPSEMGEHYGADYDRIIADAAKAPAHFLPCRNELLRHKSGGALLDLGCGSGGFLGAMKSPSWKLYGVEMSESAANVARQRCGAEVYVGDVLDAPFPPNSFDAITCFNVFEHMYEPGEVLRKVAEWLKPGGVFYTMMPNIDSAGARIFRSYWYALELPRHLFHFSPATLKMLVRSVGLRETLVIARRELYFERSRYYVVEELLRKVGISRRPMARASVSSLPWRVVNKAFRLTILPLITASAYLVGDGETITAIFTKDGVSA